MENEPPNPEEKGKASLAIYGLMLAFAPSLIFLALGKTRLFSQATGGTYALACFFSLACCFSSPFLLVRSKAGWAIALGIVFLLINLFISFAFGCGAMLSGSSI